jgi:hypothetical protein
MYCSWQALRIVTYKLKLNLRKLELNVQNLAYTLNNLWIIEKDRQS